MMNASCIPILHTLHKHRYHKKLTRELHPPPTHTHNLPLLYTEHLTLHTSPSRHSEPGGVLPCAASSLTSSLDSMAALLPLDIPG